MFMPVGWAWKTTLILCMPVWRSCRSWPATPEDRARLERTMHLVSISRQGGAQAREQMERASRLREEAEANGVHRRSDPLHGSPSAAGPEPAPAARCYAVYG